MSVLGKVKKHPQFAGRPEQEQIRLADEFSDLQRIKEKFDHLLDTAEFEANIREIEEFNPTHSLEVRSQKDQQKHETARACHLPVQLFLSKLQRPPPEITRHFTSLLRLDYGPLHAGLYVGGIVVEWDDSSLIVPRLAPTAPDVLTHIDSEGEWIDFTQDAVGKMSLAHRQHLDTPKKLEIIYNTRTEKERLIDQLVEVIVRYNCTKTYSIFRSNCQDFVKDALQSLGIRTLPKFEGNLKGYIEGLQGGKAACVTFREHSDLDAYVTANASTLGTHEKEYLVCMYFQFHIAEMTDLSPEEQEMWKCPIQRCHCEDLEHQIINDSLHFYQFRKQPNERVVSPQVSQHLAMSSIHEEPVVECGANSEAQERLDKDLGGGLEDSLSLCERQFFNPPESVKDRVTQVAFLAKCSGYSDRVKAKLRRHPMFRDQPEAEIARVSEILTEKEMFREKYFSEFIDTTSGKIICEVSHDQSKSGSLPGDELRSRSNSRFDKLFNFHMKLLLRASSRRARRLFSIAKTPLLCALQVGDYVFEWNETSLVIPVEVRCVQTEPVLLSPVHEQSEWFTDVCRERAEVRQSVESSDYEMQIELHFKWTERKDLLISAFIDKIIEFNRGYIYQQCSSQRFVEESMRSLGIKNPPKLSTSIKQHISQLKRSTALSTKRLSTHKELDTVVAEKLRDNISKEDTEYLMAHYLLFHMDSFERSSEKWTCSVRECCLQDLEEKLDSFSKTC